MVEALDAALALAARGFNVFPLSSRKLPAVKQFPSVATTEEAQIRAWFGQGGFPGVGVATGRGIAVVDVDVKNGKKGEDWLILAEIADIIPDTYRVRTASGGQHLYFRSSLDIRNTVEKIAPGVDTRGAGGYVVAHWPGYAVVDDRPLAELPTDIVAQAGLASEKAEREPAIELDTGHAIAAATNYLAHAEPAFEGAGGNHHTYRVAARLCEIGVSEETAATLMAEHWNERCQPPWPAEELAAIVGHAFTYAQAQPGSAHPAAAFDPIPHQPIETARFKGLFPDAIELDRTPRHLIEGMLDEQTSGVVYGASNSGKTFLALDMAAHIAAGRPWGGREVKQGLVVYVAAEAGLGARNRVLALKQRLDADYFPLLLISQGLDLRSNRVDAAALIDLVRDAEKATGETCRLIVIDTLSRALSGGDENSSVDMGGVVKQIDAVREGTSATVLLVHHSGKNAAAGARGHSLLRAAVDSEIEVRELATGLREVVVHKQREGARARPFEFALLPVVLGQDVRERDITSCIVALEGEAAFAFASVSPVEDGEEGGGPEGDEMVAAAVASACQDPRASVINGRGYASLQLVAAHRFKVPMQNVGEKPPPLAAYGRTAERALRRSLGALREAGIVGKTKRNQWFMSKSGQDIDNYLTRGRKSEIT